MEVEIKELLDEIMEKMHNITCLLMALENQELIGKRKTYKQVLENEQINENFQSLQLKYRILQSKMKELFEETEMEENQFGEGTIVAVYELVNNEKIEENDEIKLQKNIELMKKYIYYSYAELGYISKTEMISEEIARVTPGIYENTPYKNLVYEEYVLNILNLDVMQARYGSLTNSEEKIDFFDKKKIIDWVSTRYLNDNINYVKFYNDMSKKFKKQGDKETSELIIEQKYLEYYKYLNNMYNGFIQENDIKKFKKIKEMIDNGEVEKALKMPMFEIKSIMKMNYDEEKDMIKNIIYSIEHRNEEEEKEVEIEKNINEIENNIIEEDGDNNEVPNNNCNNEKQEIER